MKRGVHQDKGEKEAKKQKLLEQLGKRHLPYLSPKDDNFYELWRSGYPKLILLQAQSIPSELHQVVQKAFLTLLQQRCLFQDLVRLKGKDILTPVSRILIGRPGQTYKYLNTRLFAVPWTDDELNIQYSTRSLSEACKAFSDLNKVLYSQTVNELNKFTRSIENAEMVNIVQNANSKVDGQSNQGPFAHQAQESEKDIIEPYNVTLINYMDPQAMPYLKEEPYFGMGKMAVSWHHDENLVEHSTVAVYNYSYKDSGSEEHEEGRNPSLWHVGLKIAWDIETPGLAVPLNSGDCYFMLDDLNKTHQHCVLAGCQPRFSSTHRLAESSTDTLQYIRSRCFTALENLYINPDTGETSLKSLESSVLSKTEEIHSEVEFEWLRQYWFQGKRYSICTEFWMEVMIELEDHWRQMETMTSLVLKEITKENQKKNVGSEIRKCFLKLLAERHDLRLEWNERCSSKLARSLPPDQAPRCYPYWEEEDPSMPLPFDLSDIISELENMEEGRTESAELSE